VPLNVCWVVILKRICLKQWKDVQEVCSRPQEDTSLAAARPMVKDSSSAAHPFGATRFYPLPHPSPGAVLEVSGDGRCHYSRFVTEP
jgi:hypothetical protein